MDKRATLAKLVRGIHPLDDLELEHVAEALSWIESGAPLYRTAKPATPAQHLVVYFAVVDSHERRLLLLDHVLSGLWLPSGGHVDPDEDPYKAVVREADEELGLWAEWLSEEPLFITIQPVADETGGHTDISLWFALKGDITQLIQADPNEAPGAHWFDLDALPKERTDPNLARFAQKLQIYLNTKEIPA